MRYALPLCMLLSSALAQAPFNEQGKPNRDRPGPWDNDCLVYRAVAGEQAVKLATFERAGVPTVTRLKDGRLIAAHQHFPADDDANFDKVAMHFSEDEGKTWSKAQVMQVKNLPERMRFPFDPTLVALGDGKVRLYFTGMIGRRMEQSTPAIHSAISEDGVNFTYEEGVRFAVEGRPVIDCAAAVLDGVTHLYAPDNGNRPPGPGRQPPPAGAGYHATSKDGLTFTRQADVRIEEGRQRWLGGVLADGEVLRFFGTSDRGIWSATSKDGQAWKLDADFPRVPGADPGAVKLKDGSWLLVVTGPPRPGTPTAQQRGPRRGPE